MREMVSIAIRDWRLLMALIEFGDIVLKAREQTIRGTWHVPYAERQNLNQVFWRRYDKGGKA